MASPFSKLPPPLNDKPLYIHYLNTVQKLSDPSSHALYKGRCDAVCLHKGPKAWACMVAGRGILGMYNTKQEAMHHALCAAMMIEDKKNGKLKSKKSETSKDKIESDSQTDTDHSDGESESKQFDSPGYLANTNSMGERTKDLAYKPKRFLDNDNVDKNSSDDDVPLTNFKNKTVNLKNKSSPSVEMRDPVHGTILELFSSSFHASMSTGILRTKIEEACQDGGGLVNKFFFRYSSAAKDVYTEKKPSTKPPSMPLNKTEDKIPQKKSSLQSKHTLKAKATKDTFIAGHRKQLPIAAKPKATSTQPQIDFFDLLSLQPVRKKTHQSKRPKRVIELVELRTGKVIVCFRGATDACRALGLERKTVTAACEIHDRNGHVTTFKTFSIRYARSAAPCAAYVYGDHPQDYKKNVSESRSDINKRFFTQHQQDLKQQKARDPLYMEVRDDRDPFSFLHNPLSDKDNIRLEKMDTSSGTEIDATTKCLFCQEFPPIVMFAPCNHCVLCKACAEVACKTFCPICHSPIKVRMQPKLALLMRPRVFSAYSIL
mmetsp:Transcript_27266/g.41234  ORF Transcript_27266/g.41234 Transcript_27266/m.41234 type:complete len:544 (+) Transcript_27266:174-1805(+)